MAELGTTNKNFAAQVRSYELAFKVGTPEYRRRREYPGKAAAAVECSNRECLNSRDVMLTTWWLCEECAKHAPDTVKWWAQRYW